jgi:hypothetical protein
MHQSRSLPGRNKPLSLSRTAINKVFINPSPSKQRRFAFATSSGPWRRVVAECGGGTANGASGDALAAMPDGPLMTDVSVVHPTSQTYATEAARLTRAAAARRDADKVAKYRAGADGVVYDVVPLSMEKYGWANRPCGCLVSWGNWQRIGRNVSKAGFVSNWCELSVKGQGQWSALQGGGPRAREGGSEHAVWLIAAWSRPRLMHHCVLCFECFPRFLIVSRASLCNCVLSFQTFLKQRSGQRFCHASINIVFRLTIHIGS